MRIDWNNDDGKSNLQCESIGFVDGVDVVGYRRNQHGGDDAVGMHIEAIFA